MVVGWVTGDLFGARLGGSAENTADRAHKRKHKKRQGDHHTTEDGPKDELVGPVWSEKIASCLKCASELSLETPAPCLAVITPKQPGR